MDIDIGRVRVRELGGGVREGQLPGVRDRMADANIRRFTLDFDKHQLVLALPNRNDAVTELIWPGESDAQVLGDRQVVYLDQKDWSTIAAARHGVRPVSKADEQAAQNLFDQVAGHHIVVPISAAHLVEGDRLLGPNREPLASTMLELSRGWQMRHPVNIGRLELGAALGIANQPGNGAMFTLEPNAAFVRFPAPAPDYPEPLRSIMPAVIATSGIYDAVLEGESAEDVGSREAREAWVREHHELIAMLEADGASRETIKRTAVARQIVSVGEHLMREAKLDSRKVAAEWLPASWLADVEAHVSEMPYLSRVSQVHFARLRNRSRWRSNDFLDIHFLSAGAAYASIVAGEKRTIGDLRTARDVPPGAQLTSLRGVVDALRG